MAGCSSCSVTFEGFENSPAPFTCDKPLGRQGCTYTAQGEVVCGSIVDPRIQQQMRFPAVEGFMMSADRQPATEHFRDPNKHNEHFKSSGGKASNVVVFSNK